MDAISKDGSPGFDHSILFPPIFKAYTKLRRLNEAANAHSSVIKQGYESFASVGNSIADFYMKCGTINSALNAFTCITTKDSVYWNVVIHGCVEGGASVEGLQLFRKARIAVEEGGYEANEFTLVNLLQLWKTFMEATHCKSIHCQVIRMGFDSNERVVNSLIDAYAKCNLIELAWMLFIQMDERDLISWSTMIAAFSHSGKPDEAISLFHKMILREERFNLVTMLSLLDACSLSAEVRRSRCAHGLAVRSGLAKEVEIGTALLDMYSKCGAINASRRVFDQMAAALAGAAISAFAGAAGRARSADAAGAGRAAVSSTAQSRCPAAPPRSRSATAALPAHRCCRALTVHCCRCRRGSAAAAVVAPSRVATAAAVGPSALLAGPPRERRRLREPLLELTPPLVVRRLREPLLPACLGSGRRSATSLCHPRRISVAS
ncbi:hypothetical protein Scep_030471 [Stephania cephalantha]|uniref:Pentatricopeptide repeat-containing protein n=1 Tax=Stephania cephalantha TaxID=152367 RepID=A0AAP0HIN3_9MAGN